MKPRDILRFWYTKIFHQVPTVETFIANYFSLYELIIHVIHILFIYYMKFITNCLFICELYIITHIMNK